MQENEGNLNCIHELFEEQVERSPRAIAVVDGDNELVYDELNLRSNKLGSALRDLKVIPEVRVGIFLEPSIEVPVAVIAVLKAGGAYVPLDTRYPDERLGDIIKDAEVSCIVTTTALEARLPKHTPKILADFETYRLNGQSHENPKSGVSLENLALVRYTSGSTGRPKGVMNTHRSIVNRLHSIHLPDVEPDDVCAVDTNFGFGTRLMFPLVRGSRIILISSDCMRDVGALHELLVHRSVTSIFMIPTHIREFLRLDSLLLSKLNLRVVVTGGETLTAEIVRQFQIALPHTLLINTYGSNEIGGTATVKVYMREDLPGREGSIGCPVVNTSVSVLDEEGDQLSPGTEGEICVASQHLARGYLNQPRLTAEQFVPDPFSPISGARLFRTRDLGRVLPSGEIQFMGRKDRQIKIRGFRVELEEIENALQAHQEIRRSVVTVRNIVESSQIVAYVVLQLGSNLTTIQIRAYLRSKIPEYMIPGLIILLDGLPLTSTGKVDRLALPEPPRPESVPSTLEDDRSNAIEIALVDLWEEFLGVRGIGVHDHFMDSGGDSITAMKLTAAIWDRFGLRLPVSSIFEYPTIASIAEHLSSLVTQNNDVWRTSN